MTNKLWTIRRLDKRAARSHCSAMRLAAPAKINLHLRVGRPTPDGFHPLLTWMCTISLFDTLMMLGLLAGGLGLVVRSLQAASIGDSDSDSQRSPGEHHD